MDVDEFRDRKSSGQFAARLGEAKEGYTDHMDDASGGAGVMEASLSPYYAGNDEKSVWAREVLASWCEWL